MHFFPNMSVEENLLFVKKDKKLSNKLLDITELSLLKDKLPQSLSGGQKQRVSLCRALMKNPKLLLMDEPFSALDPSIRLKLQNEILALHKEFNITTIMVSHNLNEIYRLANRVIILKNGKIIKNGKPIDILLKKDKNHNNLSFDGELLDIKKIDNDYIAVIAISQKIIEIKTNKDLIKNLKIGEKVTISTKSFSPVILH